MLAINGITLLPYKDQDAFSGSTFTDPRWLTQRQADLAGGNNAYCPPMSSKTRPNQNSPRKTGIWKLSGVIPSQLSKGVDVKLGFSMKTLYNVEQCFGVLVYYSSEEDTQKHIYMGGTLPTLENLQPLLDELESERQSELFDTILAHINSLDETERAKLLKELL